MIVLASNSKMKFENPDPETSMKA